MEQLDFHKFHLREEGVFSKKHVIYDHNDAVVGEAKSSFLSSTTTIEFTDKSLPIYSVGKEGFFSSAATIRCNGEVEGQVIGRMLKDELRMDSVIIRI